MSRSGWAGAALAVLVAALAAVQIALQQVSAGAQGSGVPEYEVDPFWPKPLPNDWILGETPNVVVDPQDHVWVVTRPRTLRPDDIGLTAKPPIAECCRPAPPVIEFDAAGNVVRSWGPVDGKAAGYDWPDDEHGIFLDYKGNVWIGGNGAGDGQVLKFTKDGKFLLQIGKPEPNFKPTPGIRGTPPKSNSLERLNLPANVYVWPQTNEVFIADGYGNRRIIVYDADTGAYKRHWGAYGNRPDDQASNKRTFEGAGPPQFNTMHAVTISNDGILYASDRQNNRIQMFTPDGKFLKEVFIARQTLDNRGTAFEVSFSADKEQRFVFVPDGANYKVRILDRKTMAVLSSFGRHGPYAGSWIWLHGIAADSKGNIYTAESRGARLQRFVPKGTRR
jgi:DNA-binding beta-propeller fold protein YncE